MAQHTRNLSFTDFMFQKWLQGAGLGETATTWNRYHPERPTTVADVRIYFAAYSNGGDAERLPEPRGHDTQ